MGREISDDDDDDDKEEEEEEEEEAEEEQEGTGLPKSLLLDDLLSHRIKPKAALIGMLPHGNLRIILLKSDLHIAPYLPCVPVTGHTCTEGIHGISVWVAGYSFIVLQAMLDSAS